MAYTVLRAYIMYVYYVHTHTHTHAYFFITKHGPQTSKQTNKQTNKQKCKQANRYMYVRVSTYIDKSHATRKTKNKHLLKCKQTEKESLQHWLFPGGHPSKYWASPTLLNFSDQTGTGAFSVVWS